MGLLSFISFLSSIFPSPSSLPLSLPDFAILNSHSRMFSMFPSSDIIHSFIPLACAECDDSWLFLGASSIPVCYIPFLPPTSLPSSLTSSCHLFLSLVLSKFIHNTLLEILLSSILCTCPNQHNLFNLLISLFLNIVHLYAQLPARGTDLCSTVWWGGMTLLAFIPSVWSHQLIVFQVSNH